MPTPEFIIPSWLNDQDSSTIHKRMMEALPPDIDNTDGGFPWDFTKPTALEKSEMLQFHLVETLRIMHPMWAYDRWLDYHASGVGTSRKLPNSAYGVLTVNGIPGTEIPKDFIFAVPAVGDNSAVEFNVSSSKYIDENGSCMVEVIAKEPGIKGNVPANTITIMSTPMSGITSVTNLSKTSGGTDEEEDDTLRERISEINENSDASYVGCDGDYKRWAKEVSGVGDAFVIPEWSGPNSVKVIILDANGEPANENIINSVYKYIFSPEDRMLRKAPVGAILTVSAPTAKLITYSFDVVLNEGETLDSVIDWFGKELRKYYAIAKEENVVRYNKISSILISTSGVKDFSNLAMNGSTTNISLNDGEYPVTGLISPTIPRQPGVST